jgi:SagB-type dehydrogenase family enzyme
MTNIFNQDKTRMYTVAATGAILIVVIFVAIMYYQYRKANMDLQKPLGQTIKLPQPIYDSNTSIEETLLARRSIRSYRQAHLSLSDISQLLWAAQGITHPGGYRTAPSAGALYPLELYLLAGNINDFPPGLYKYIPDDHMILQMYSGDRRAELSQAALNQEAIMDAPAIIIISAVYKRTTIKYGERGIQYVHMEVGHTAQNIYLQAASLGLGTVFIGAFDNMQVKNALDMMEAEEPLGIMPVGYPKR